MDKMSTKIATWLRWSLGETWGMVFSINTWLLRSRKDL